MRGGDIFPQPMRGFGTPAKARAKARVEAGKLSRRSSGRTVELVIE